MNILILHGPNLNLLGEREPEVYGRTSLSEINQYLYSQAKKNNTNVRIFQSNHEGVLIDYIHEFRKWADAIIINPGAFTHYSYAIRDALTAFSKQVIEVHLTDIMNRESFRRQTVFEGLPNVSRIIGKGANGYYEALDKIVSNIS